MNENHKKAFNRHLNETHAPIRIAGMTYYPAQVLEECDPIAYRVLLTDYIDELREYLDEESLAEMGVN